VALSASERHWRAVREAVYARLDADGYAHMRALADEYVEAMRSGARLRELAEQAPSVELKSGRIVVNPLFEAADRDLRRGVQLAKCLELNKPGKRASVSPFAQLDGETEPGAPTDIASRRRRRTKGGDSA
jgi:hypothetical protein